MVTNSGNFDQISDANLDISGSLTVLILLHSVLSEYKDYSLSTLLRINSVSIIKFQYIQ